ncbi:hypothetical protein L2E82_36179 [Cichorium intybus]|uniref:Uncharacterized protein n=1 Tax=Cichorium intybus TaxID=13427 RepID=A0ACB9BR15_CICIN|nr:hypothetical protein L2E82_36179 [Cichorium intybus]
MLHEGLQTCVALAGRWWRGKGMASREKDGERPAGSGGGRDTRDHNQRTLATNTLFKRLSVDLIPISSVNTTKNIGNTNAASSSSITATNIKTTIDAFSSAGNTTNIENSSAVSSFCRSPKLTTPPRPDSVNLWVLCFVVFLITSSIPSQPYEATHITYTAPPLPISV